MGLKKENRLRHRADFLKAYAKGRAIGGRCFTVFVLDRGDEGSVRFGFTVTRRLGNAVVRNGMKRRLRASVREFVDGVRLGHDIVVNAKHPALDLRGEKIGRDLREALEEARVLNR